MTKGRAAATITAAVLLVTGCSNGPSQADAWAECKRQVAAKLDNPDSADFELTGVEMGEAPGGWYATGNLTGEYDYGRVERLAFECAANHDFELTEARVRRAR